MSLGLDVPPSASLSFFPPSQLFCRGALLRGGPPLSSTSPPAGSRGPFPDVSLWPGPITPSWGTWLRGMWLGGRPGRQSKPAEGHRPGWGGGGRLVRSGPFGPLGHLCGPGPGPGLGGGGGPPAALRDGENSDSSQLGRASSCCGEARRLVVCSSGVGWGLFVVRTPGSRWPHESVLPGEDRQAVWLLPPTLQLTRLGTSSPG